MSMHVFSLDYIVFNSPDHSVMSDWTALVVLEGIPVAIK